MKPSLSILTPSKDYAIFIQDSLLSVSQQNSKNVEHVVIDGNSTDATRDILERFTGQIKWLSEPDKGQSDALNKAFELSQGSWVGWLNADEFYLPGALNYVSEQIRNEPNVDIFFGDSIFVNERGGFLRLMAHHPFNRRVLRNYGCFINSCSAFFRRDLLLDDGWDVTLDRIMDWDLWLRFEERNARFKYLPRPLGVYRIHSGQQTSEVASPTSKQNVLVRKRHNLPTSGLIIRARSNLGRLERITLKGLSGGYFRQRSADEALKGSNLRWFDPSFSTDTGAALASLLAGGHTTLE